MGKRRERRLAAMMGAGRRVKLDLFAEPSGDVGGFSAKDEVGKDMDAELDAELSNSPSSSGGFCQKEDNPLSLLGQYSDDELNQESNETGSIQKDSLVADHDQTKASISKLSEEGEIVDDEDVSVQNTDSCHLETNSGLVSALQIVEAAADDKHLETSKESIDHVPEPCDTGTAGGASSCWKMVLHEESNQYYYWNTVTGETSWEVLDALSQGTGTASGVETLGTEMRESGGGDINASGTASGVKSDDISTMHSLGYMNGLSNVAGICERGLRANHSVVQSKGDVTQLLGSSSEVGALPCEAASLVNYSQVNLVNVGAVSTSALGYELDGYSISSEQGAVDPFQLINHGEALLERLKSLQWWSYSLNWHIILCRCGFDSVEHGWIPKYISEVEIRIYDMRSLLPYGSSLVPFWLHSERQLNQVENGINTEIERQKNKISEMHLSSAEENKETVEDRGECKVNVDMRKFSSENSSAIVHDTDASVDQEALHDEASNVEMLNVKQVSADGHLTQLHAVEEGVKEIDGTAQRKESPKSGFQSGDDVDMDIEMEVEDAIPATNRTLVMGGQTVTPSEQLAQPNVSAAGEFLGAGSEFIPPPPDEEWIPPPPPDNEGIPPPPAEEPPESLCPPPPPAEPEPEPGQPIYSDPYNLTYADSNVNYCGNANTGTSAGSFYEPADGSQISVLNAPIYYAAVSDVQPAAAPVNSAVYYGLQNGGMPVDPMDSAIVSLGFQAASGLVNRDPLFSNQIATEAASGPSSLSNQSIEPHVSGAMTDAVSTEASTSVISALATISVKEYVSVPTFSTVGTSVSVPSKSTVSDTSTAVPKAQAKGNLLDSDGYSMSYGSQEKCKIDIFSRGIVHYNTILHIVCLVNDGAVRMKKPKVTVASSLRSNKKVSSLVDKWKAAKEELEEEEGEVRESPLEILEKKRQREIEEWRAKQIASGEAKENANFQPLGGDWRERVKRRRAQKEAVAESSSDAINNGTKQPDLDQLSRDLPSGWQAYWDDSMKQVYYGNSITSETTWTKPTR
ncbi:hypothetical protein Cgig2_015418 [Carnegiea gigantea]|uniref:WW domain-containing protein n=1 Tax=Carnegiea gigantea TaxID=171969 RepID=A0A9Q1GMU0_9CARY|nr:hypothetical protein Cgig2_015418 [Carnegiea gigantea]